jgi:putative SOS response-associated peptidase YedK
MCVRYTLHKSDAALSAVAKAISRIFNLPTWVENRYNIRISEVAPVFAIQDGDVCLEPMTFGMVSPYAKEHGRKKLLHNARSETVTRLHSFRDPVWYRRCLIPANGFYESMTVGKFSRPFVFMLKDEEPFAIAGIWEPPTDETGQGSFSMLTTHPNEVVEPLHDRMPVVLTAKDMPRWLGSDPLPDTVLAELCRPIPGAMMVAKEVNRYGNKPRSEGPRCLAPPDEAEPELPLSL